MTDQKVNTRGEWLQQLTEMVMSERRSALNLLVVSLLKEKLLMGESDNLQTDKSYFELGLTSLAVVELQEELEFAINSRVDAASLFKYPTVDRLVEHIRSEVLPEYFSSQSSGAPNENDLKDISKSTDQDVDTAKSLLSEILGGN